MIVWLNGAYGAGKSITAERIRELCPGTLIFDAEAVGNAVRDNLEPVLYHTEFPDYAIWREFVAKLLAEMAARAEGPILVPMTVLSSAYIEEIRDRLRDVPFHHIVLDLSPDKIRERVLGRGETPEHWCYQQADRCAALLDGLPGSHLDASGTVDQVAREILTRLGLIKDET